MIRLSEYVPFDKTDKVHAGLKSSGVDSYAEGTFGVEFELMTEMASVTEENVYDAMEGLGRTEFLRVLRRSGALDRMEQDYSEWVFEQREQDNRYGYTRRGGKASDWDDSHGPIDYDTWAEHNPEPERAGFDDDESFDEALKTWRDEAYDVNYDYNRWERTGQDAYLDEFIGEIFSERRLEEYADMRDLSYQLGLHGDGNSTDMKEYLSKFLKSIGEKINPREQGTETEWGVGDDGDNVEIRSKHLKKSDFGALKAFMAFIKKQGYEVSGGTSAHVHVGVPKNFDYFDLLAMLTLVDEKKLVSDEGPGRLFGEWAKLRDGIEKQFSDKLKYSETLESGEEVIYDRSKMREFISVVAKKYSGTNISAFFEHGTVEFRYFSSRMINKPDTFLNWIEYFMLLPRVAMKRNKFEFAGYTFVREGNNEIKVVKGKKASTSNRKASDLKTTVPPPQLSKLDPKEKQVLKYLEKYKSKAEEVGGIEKMDKKEQETLKKLTDLWSKIAEKYHIKT